MRTELAIVAACLVLGCTSTDTTANDAALADAATLDGATTDGAALDAAAPTDAACAASNDATVSLPDGGTVDLRGVRYCEVLLATLSGGMISADVYNTIGLSDCPDAAWSALDPAAITTASGVTATVLNGPRYWLIDRFESAMLLDPAVRTFGCIPMRLGGRVTGTTTSLSMAPYTLHTVMRDTTVVFTAGHMVYELVDPTGQVFDMQSYSVQRMPQTEVSLATLGARLTLPTGWTFRARTLDADLQVTAVGGRATVVQDDFGNTYQLSQQ